MSEQLALFGESEENALVDVVKRKTRGAAGWQLSNHACRYCFGRVLERKVGGVTVEVRCAECGAHAHGSHEEICACGADCGDIGYALKCVRNPHVTKENPHEILIKEVPRAAQAPDLRAPKTVRLSEF